MEKMKPSFVTVAKIKQSGRVIAYVCPRVYGYVCVCVCVCLGAWEWHTPHSRHPFQPRRLAIHNRGSSPLAAVAFVSPCIESFGNRHINSSQHNISIQIHSPFKANGPGAGPAKGCGVRVRGVGHKSVGSCVYSHVRFATSSHVP